MAREAGKHDLLMDTLKEEEQSAVDGSDKLPAQTEDTEWEQPITDGREEELEFGEEIFLKDQEPYDYHCYSGWEEAVRGWARVAPLACIFVPQKKKHRNKQADDLLPTDRKSANAKSSTSCIKYNCDPCVKSLQSEAAVRPEVRDGPLSTLHMLLRERTEEVGTLTVSEKPSLSLIHRHLSSKYPVVENRRAIYQKHRLTKTVVPTKILTFFPQIKSPDLSLATVSGQFCCGKKALKSKSFKTNSGKRGTRVDPDSPDRTPSGTKHQSHSDHPWVSTVRVCHRYEVPPTSKCDSVRHVSYLMDEHLTQDFASRGVAGPHVRTKPSFLFSS